MMKKHYATIFNGREYGKEMDGIDEAELKKNGIVILFGYSDDNMEFRGAIDDEIGCWGGRTVYLTKNGLLENPGCLHCDDCSHYKKSSDSSRSIKAIWSEHAKDSEYAWRFETDIPHETFEIFEEGEKFCLGIVFNMADV